MLFKKKNSQLLPIIIRIKIHTPHYDLQNTICLCLPPQYTTVPLNPSGSWLLSVIGQACSCFRTTLLVPSAWNTFSRSPHDWLLLRSLLQCHLWKRPFSDQSVFNISPSTTALFPYLLFKNVIYCFKFLLEYNWFTMLCFRSTAKWTCYTNTYIHLF